MKNAKILLKDILKLKRDLESQKMNLPPGLAGMYGELLAFQKLQQVMKREKMKISYFSGQKGADIQVENGKDKINIEVKTSRLKDEGFGWWYGAALNIKKCNKQKHADKCYVHPKRGKILGDFCYFDYLIFVALDKNLTKPKFFVIPRSFIEKYHKLLRNTHARFSSATHRIILSNGRGMPRMADAQKKLIRQTEQFRNRWEIIN